MRVYVYSVPVYEALGWTLHGKPLNQALIDKAWIDFKDNESELAEAIDEDNELELHWDEQCFYVDIYDSRSLSEKEELR